jgi:hypothetical protein
LGNGQVLGSDKGYGMHNQPLFGGLGNVLGGADTVNAGLESVASLAVDKSSSAAAASANEKERARTEKESRKMNAASAAEKRIAEADERKASCSSCS